VTKVETRLCDKNYTAGMVLRFDGDRQKPESCCLPWEAASRITRSFFLIFRG